MNASHCRSRVRAKVSGSTKRNLALSIEDLLLAADTDGSWGARAWDVGLTVRCVDPAHDTVVPLRDGSGSSSGSGIGITGRRTVVDIFVDEPSSDAAALTYDAGVQVDARLSPPAENEDVLQAAARVRAVADEVQGKRTLLEAKWCSKTHNHKALEPFPEVVCVVPAPSCDDADSDSSSKLVVRGGVSLGLESVSVSELPSYVFLVGLGLCMVVLQVVLKRGAGRLNFCLNYSTAITTTATMLFPYSYISSRIR